MAQALKSASAFQRDLAKNLSEDLKEDRGMNPKFGRIDNLRFKLSYRPTSVGRGAGQIAAAVVVAIGGLFGVPAVLAEAPSAGVSAGVSGEVRDGARVQVSSLEVRSRIASMEQVNVTAEKAIDEQAPAASQTVADLLAELDRLEEAGESSEASRSAE